MIEQSRPFTLRLLAGLSQRLHHLLSDLEAYCLQSATQRVIGYLMSAHESAGTVDVPAQIQLPASKHLIASRLNLTPESFSRILHLLTEAGLIRVEKRVILILDPIRLQNYGRT